MDYLVLGAGKQGEAIAYDLLKDGNVTLLDGDRDRLVAASNRLKGVTPILGDMGDADLIAAAMEENAVAVSAVPYDFNLDLTKAAIAAGTHFVDLGGNNTVVGKQFALSDDAKEAGVTIVPDCGIAPGAVSVVAAYAIEQFGRTPSFVQIRVGGLPQHPQGILQYMGVFSTHGLINEYKEPVEVLADGKRTIVAPIGGIEQILFPEPFGTMEAAYTSGGSSTLTQTFEGKIKELDYKTIRYPGHWEKIKTLMDLGFFEEMIEHRGTQYKARELAEAVLERAITYKDQDALLMRVSVGNDDETLSYTLIDYEDPIIGHTAMQRTTGYSAAIIAKMLRRGTISERGTLYQELSVPRRAFLDEWAKRDLLLEESREETSW